MNDNNNNQVDTKIDKIETIYFDDGLPRPFMRGVALIIDEKTGVPVGARACTGFFETITAAIDCEVRARLMALEAEFASFKANLVKAYEDNIK